MICSSYICKPGSFMPHSACWKLRWNLTHLMLWNLLLNSKLKWFLASLYSLLLHQHCFSSWIVLLLPSGFILLGKTNHTLLDSSHNSRLSVLLIIPAVHLCICPNMNFSFLHVCPKLHTMLSPVPWGLAGALYNGVVFFTAHHIGASESSSD